MRVLRALLSAGLADLRTYTAHVASIATSARNKTCSETTKGSAIERKRDAPRHGLNMRFTKTRGSAAVARVSASVAGGKAIQIDFRHDDSPDGVATF